jgi:hypothetical protein
MRVFEHSGSGVDMLQSTQHLIEHNLASIDARDEALARQLRTLTEVVLNGPSLTASEKRVGAELLAEITEDLGSGHRRTTEAMNFLVDGFTRALAQGSEVGALWAAIEPRIRRS